MVKPPEDLNATLFEDSVMLYDAGNNEDEVTSMQAGHVCIICKKNQYELTASNPLVHFCPTNKAFAYCKTCLDEYVQSNTRMAFKSNGVIEYFIDGLAVPDTGREFPAKYKLHSVPQDLVRLQYPFAPYYMVLERVNYTRPAGHKEGFVLRFGMDDQESTTVTFGAHPQNDVYISEGLCERHFSVLYSEGVFFVADHALSSGTYVAKQGGKFVINEYFSKRTVLARDLIIDLHFREQDLVPPSEAVDDQVDLFPQALPASAYLEFGRETGWERDLSIPAAVQQPDQPPLDIPAEMTDIDDDTGEGPLHSARTVRQFSCRFKEALIDRSVLN
jgi:hypothetical protein